MILCSHIFLEATRRCPTFSKLKIWDEVIAFDAAGALMQFARHHAEDFMKEGDYYHEALNKEWQKLLD
jgi:hypothetical protein